MRDVTKIEALESAVQTLIDIVDELAHDVSKDDRWLVIVRRVLKDHRDEIREAA